MARPARERLTDPSIRLSELATCCISMPGARIGIDCDLSVVLTASIAEMTPDTRTLMLLPRALPSMLPPTWRVSSDQVPETVPLLWLQLPWSSKLVLSLAQRSVRSTLEPEPLTLYLARQRMRSLALLDVVIVPAPTQQPDSGANGPLAASTADGSAATASRPAAFQEPGNHDAAP